MGCCAEMEHDHRLQTSDNERVERMDHVVQGCLSVLQDEFKHPRGRIIGWLARSPRHRKQVFQSTDRSGSESHCPPRHRCRSEDWAPVQWIHNQMHGIVHEQRSNNLGLNVGEEATGTGQPLVGVLGIDTGLK